MLHQVSAPQHERQFAHLETSEPIGPIVPQLTTANAYLGAAAIVEALQAGADLVVTGRVADPSLVVAPCVHQLGWQWDQWAMWLMSAGSL